MCFSIIDANRQKLPVLNFVKGWFDSQCLKQLLTLILMRRGGVVMHIQDVELLRFEIRMKAMHILQKITIYDYKFYNSTISNYNVQFC